MASMTPQALNLDCSSIPEAFDYIIYSPMHGLISEHLGEDDARLAFETYLAEFELGEYLPMLLRREGSDWDFA